MTDHRDWQRKTALSRIEQLRKDSAAPIPDKQAAAKAAQYVGTTSDQVIAWMRGAK